MDEKGKGRERIRREGGERQVGEKGGVRREKK